MTGSVAVPLLTLVRGNGVAGLPAEPPTLSPPPRGAPETRLPEMPPSSYWAIAHLLVRLPVEEEEELVRGQGEEQH